MLEISYILISQHQHSIIIRHNKAVISNHFPIKQIKHIKMRLYMNNKKINMDIERISTQLKIKKNYKKIMRVSFQALPVKTIHKSAWRDQ